ncbi:MAG: thiolase family protein [Armatimonadetes bacterium]|nr:thiolase family protein [Armatimonadota bacterium]
MPKAVIVDAVRTPIGRFGGALREVSAGELAAHVIDALLDRNGVPPERVDEVILGQVLPAGSSANVARRAALAAGLPHTVCARTVNRVCASGMQAAEDARRGILLGEGGLYIAGGVESMSNVPHYTSDVRWGRKLGSVALLDGVMDEGLVCPVTGMKMGVTAERLGESAGLTRVEADAFALRSQQRAQAAIDEGRFAAETVPVPRRKGGPFAVDEHPRETSLEALAALPTVFAEGGTVTAGNASGINDGAAALLVAEEQTAQELALRSRATVLASAVAGIAPELMGLGPGEAVRKLCARLGIGVSDFDLVELNEAFAVQALAVIRELGLNEERVNVNGGAIALGHPLGASGARIVTTLVHEMERRDVRLGLATLCIGGGMGMAMAIEREG